MNPWHWVLACAWRRSRHPGWNPWHLRRERKTWIEEAACWSLAGWSQSIQKQPTPNIKTSCTESYKEMMGGRGVNWDLKQHLDTCEAAAAFLTCFSQSQRNVGIKIQRFFLILFIYTQEGSNPDQCGSPTPPPYSLSTPFLMMTHGFHLSSV